MIGRAPARHGEAAAPAQRGFARELARRDEAALASLLARDPVQNVYLRSELRSGVAEGEWWGVEDRTGIRSVLSGGTLLIPWLSDLGDAGLLAPALNGRTVRMLVGPRESVLALHRALRREAYDIREPQPLLGVTPATLAETPLAPLRRASRRDLDELVVAAAAMHREEMGVDPLHVDAHSWRARMTSLVDRGWSWIWAERGRVLFKAELSAWTPEAVQIQGVYTAPHVRGRGVATRGLAAMCRALLQDTATCTLYVNHYNAAALAVYERLGFMRVGTYATVIY